ncbi:MAG: ATP-binding protein [Chromatiales bacterium]|nr:ATP-binding protein [Chromatiales bacterium]
MKSIRGMLTLRLTATLALVLGLQWLLVSLAIYRVAENYIASRLEHDAETLLTAVGFGRGELRVRPDRMPLIYRKPYSGHYYRVAYEDQVIRSSSLWDEDLQVDLAPGALQSRNRIPGPGGQRLLVLNHAYEKGGYAFTITVADDLTPIDADVTRFRWHYGLITLGIFLLIVFLHRGAVGRALQPLQATRNELRRLEAGETETLDEGVPDEIRPLVHEINHLAGVTRERLQRSRNALGDLAHAIKTPLAVLTQIADRHSGSDDLQEPIERIRQQIERYLRRARLAGEGTPGRRFDVTEELSSLVAVLRSIHGERALRFELAIPPGLVYPGDREDLLELLGNLLDNAAKWAHGHVRITATSTAESLRLAVEDDGPGVPPERLADLARRGERLDEQTQGHGLGLAIAADIAAHYRAQLAFGRSADLGGFRVDLHFPLRSAE